MLSVDPEGKKYVKTIAVASGKGGVGKTNITASLAIAMRKLGKNVVILDADLGLSNINILLNKHSKYNIRHLLEGKAALKDILIEGPHGIKILPAGEGVQDLTHLDEFQRLRLLEAFDSYDGEIDILLIDNSAGIFENVTFFCSAAQDLVIVTTPEPTAWVDAYHLIKVLYTEYQENKFHVIVNSVKNEAEGRQVLRHSRGPRTGSSIFRWTTWAIFPMTRTSSRPSVPRWRLSTSSRRNLFPSAWAKLRQRYWNGRKKSKVHCSFLSVTFCLRPRIPHRWVRETEHEHLAAERTIYAGL